MILKKKLKQQIKPQNISDIADLFNVKSRDPFMDLGYYIALRKHIVL